MKRNFLIIVQIFSIHAAMKDIGKLTVIQISLVPHNSVRISRTPNCLFCGFPFFEGEMSNLEHAQHQELLTPWKYLNVSSQYIVECKIYCFKSRQSSKWEVEKFLSKTKKVVQSRDQTHIFLSLIQGRNRNQCLYHYMIALLHQHHGVMHAF